VCRQLEEEEGAAHGLAYQVLSAFNEAFNNLALHAGKVPGRAEAEEPVAADRGTAEIQISLEVGARSLVLELRDQGEPFEMHGLSPPNLAELPESGLGLFIMQSFMTVVEYMPRAEGQTNILRMVRNYHESMAPDMQEIGDRTEQRNEDA
jgi:serine/threonine-protein kinase RsbW